MRNESDFASKTKSMDNVLTFAKVMSKSYKQLTEEEFDTVDEQLEKVKIAFESELSLFIFELLKDYSHKFNWSFASPNSELFGQSWQSLQDRYQLMGDADKIDLYKKIGMYMIKVFLELFPNAGEQAAVEMAMVFKDLMVERLREKSVQARKV